MQKHSQDTPQVSLVTVQDSIVLCVLLFFVGWGGGGGVGISRCLGEPMLRNKSKVVPAGIRSTIHMLMHDNDIYSKRIKHSFPYINVCQARV